MWEDKDLSNHGVDVLETFNILCPVFHLLEKIDNLYESCVEPFKIDADVMLVCKYLKAHRDKNLDHLCRGMYNTLVHVCYGYGGHNAKLF